MKTMSQWKESKKDLTRFLDPGDIVDDEIYYYCLEVLPPEVDTSRALCMGGPWDHVDGFPRYITLLRNTEKQWYYAGIMNKFEALERVGMLSKK